MVARVTVALAVLVLMASTTGAARAHGRCGCLKPESGPAGTRVTAGYPIFKVIFNPDRSDLGIGPHALWKDHRGPPPMMVYRETWRYSGRALNGGRAFTVPRVPPGRYLVALYDGGEGGQHYSWETFTVTGSAAARPTSNSGSSSSTPALAIVIGAAAAGLLIGYVIGTRRRRAV